MEEVKIGWILDFNVDPIGFSSVLDEGMRKVAERWICH